MLFRTCDNLQYHLNTGMSEFTRITEDAWGRLMTAKTADGIVERAVRQYGKCQCNERKCLRFEFFSEKYVLYVISFR